MEIGETLEQCVIRETKEETGLDIEITGLLGTYTDPAHVIAYAGGEVRQEFDITYYARVIGGHLAVSDESIDVRFLHPRQLRHEPIHETVRLRCDTISKAGRSPTWAEQAAAGPHRQQAVQRPRTWRDHVGHRGSGRTRRQFDTRPITRRRMRPFVPGMRGVRTFPRGRG
ncbi:NUDIX hydrolase [Nocardia sp. NPDC004573]